MTAHAPDFYTRIHKSIRRQLAQIFVTLGATGAGDITAWGKVETEWQSLSAFLASGSGHEDDPYPRSPMTRPL